VKGLCFQPLAELLKEIRTGPFGSSLHASEYQPGGVPVVNPQHYRNGKIEPDPDVAVSPEVAERLAAFALSAGDVVVARRGEMGRCAVVSPKQAGWVLGTGSASLRPSDRLSPHYLSYFLRSPTTVRALTTASVGSTMANLNQRILLDLPCLAPPLDDQHRIVAAIETHFSRLDAAVASLTRAKANVKRARASVLKAAVEGRLVPTEAALARAEARNYEPASVLVARVEQPPRPNRYNTRSTDVVPGHAGLSVGDTRGALPEGWTRAPMVNVARMESGHTPSRNHPEWWDGDVPWIGIADAREHHGGVIYATEQHTNADGLANSAARLLPAGTVCISRTASVGYVVVMGRPMATSQDFADWICTEALDPHWVRVVFLADRDALLRFGKGSVHKTIYFPELLSLHVAIPPLAEQHRIVAEVDRRLSVLDALAASLDANLARCARLRQAVLKRAFEGRLVPTEAP
jgi:type I restriction enzyme S subunit